MGKPKFGNALFGPGVGWERAGAPNALALPAPISSAIRESAVAGRSDLNRLNGSAVHPILTSDIW